ncbi:MAG: hypothetical protein N3F09_07200 [Bacteroidia bacterium]|nr:hypothetical protein [Bacteroidia bacterium]
MALQVNIHDILTQLYVNREVVEYLFAHRDNISANQLVAATSISTEQYQKLISLELIYEYEGMVFLNDAVIALFEDFMEIGEVTPGLIQDLLSELRRQMRYYQEVHEIRFLRGIKKYLKRIHSTISREIIKLQKNVDETYKNEANFRIKLQKLEAYREKRDLILDFIKNTEEILEECRKIFMLSNDAELYNIILMLKAGLIENMDYLIEIQTDITDFINKIQYQLDVYVKVQQLKEIKDQGNLYFRTNFRQVVEGLKPLRLNGIRGPRTRIAVDFLYTDEGHALSKKFAEKYKISRMMLRGLAGKLPDNFKEKLIDRQIKLDVSNLVDKFLAQNQKDLFLFIMETKFPKSAGEITFEDRLSLFVEIAMEHEKKLEFQYTLAPYEYEYNGEKRKLKYTVILPAKIQKRQPLTVNW